MDRPTLRDCEGCRALIRTEVKRRVAVPHTCGHSTEEIINYVKEQKDLYDYNVRKSFYFNVYWKDMKQEIKDHVWKEDVCLDKTCELSKKKILIIGQAPPAVEQVIPYDTTMLYTWLDAIGISQQIAQSLFEFDAVFGKFPGYDENGGHKIPEIDQMRAHYKTVLKDKIEVVDKVIVLGRVAEAFFKLQTFNPLKEKKTIYLMHPSKRNYSLYKKSQETLHKLLKEFIEE